MLLDVVYNHTAEADDKDPYTLCMRGVDNKTYYMIDPSQWVAGVKRGRGRGEREGRGGSGRGKVGWRGGACSYAWAGGLGVRPAC